MILLDDCGSSYKNFDLSGSLSFSSDATMCNPVKKIILLPCGERYTWGIMLKGCFGFIFLFFWLINLYVRVKSMGFSKF